MKLPHLNGWQRIGIVVSVIWFVGFPLHILMGRPDDAIKVHRIELNNCYDQRVTYDAKEQCLAQASAHFYRSLSEAKSEWPIILALDLATIAFGWLVAWLVVSVTRWIRAGFVRDAQ